VAGLRGWRWIFILEGLLSTAFGVSAFFLLPDTPLLSGRWLSEREQRYISLLHYATRGGGAAGSDSTNAEGEKKTKFNWKVIRQVLTDRNLYLQAVVFASNTIPNSKWSQRRSSGNSN
jgi:MFS family permease